MKKKIFTLSVIFIFCFAFCLAFIFSKKAKEPDCDFSLWNGTGKEIQAIEIQSKKDNIACSIEKISIPDKGQFGFKLPDNMKYKDEYQIIIKYGNRRAKAKKGTNKHGRLFTIFINNKRQRIFNSSCSRCNCRRTRSRRNSNHRSSNRCRCSLGNDCL